LDEFMHFSYQTKSWKSPHKIMASHLRPLSRTTLTRENGHHHVLFNRESCPELCCVQINRYIPDVKRHYDVAGRVARCINTSCTGYMNPFCGTTNMRWFCSMCGYKNNITRNQVHPLLNLGPVYCTHTCRILLFVGFHAESVPPHRHEASSGASGPAGGLSSCIIVRLAVLQITISRAFAYLQFFSVVASLPAFCPLVDVVLIRISCCFLFHLASNRALNSAQRTANPTTLLYTAHQLPSDRSSMCSWCRRACNWILYRR